MDVHQHLPDTNRLSVITATIFLAYALLPFVDLPGQQISVQLPGFLFQLALNFSTVVSILVALLAAAGTDWLIQGHPTAAGSVRLPNWLLPALTAWVIGVPLTTLEVSTEWWAVFALGGLLFVLVLVAEYIVVDPDDARHAPASVGLIAVSFALYLVLTISIRVANLRLYGVLFAVAPTVFLVTLRTLYLRSNGRWFYGWAAGIMVVVGQVAVGLHYLPLTPLRYGLVLTGLTYALVSLASGIEDRREGKIIWIEPAIMLTIFWGLALLVRS
ncbi:MAG: hypothetical protein D9V45_13750 [Chloroflexi bacterium]|nr:MAG: hypothetical protein D9V45_13750 [Chloroflexota bacterium]